MSRRKREVVAEFAIVDVVCGLGHMVGQVTKLSGKHSQAGKYATIRGVRFEDSPAPTAVSGRVRGRCGDCGADVQIRWDRVKDMLDLLEITEGRHTGEISER